MDKIRDMGIHYSNKIKFLDLLVVILIIVFVVLSYMNIAEWHVSGGMDAGNYNNIAYDWINDWDFNEDVEYFDDNYVCLSGYKCLEGEGRPLYLHTYPLLLAGGALIAKGIGPAVIQTMLAGLTLLAFYILIRLVSERKTAFLSTLILSLIPLQIIYSKEFMSETLSQLIFFISMIFLYLWIKKENYIYHMIEVVFYSLLLLTKLDAILVLIPIGALYVWLSFKKKLQLKDLLPFFLFILVGAYYYFVAGNYTDKSYWQGIEIPFAALSIGIFPFILLIVHLFITYLPSKLKNQFDRVLTKKNIKIMIFIFSILVIGVVIYRALPFISFIWGERSEEVNNLNYNRVNIIRLTYFIPLTLILLSLIGYFRFILKEKIISSILVSTIFLAFGLTLISSQHSSSIYWWGRRYLLFGVPFIAFLSSYFLYYLFKKNWISKVFLILILPLIFVPLSLRALPAIEYEQNDGINAQVYDFATSIPDDELVLMPSGWTQYLVGSSISSIYDKNIRIYKDIKEVDIDTIPDETILVTDSSLVEDPSRCSTHKFDYSYYYVVTPICMDGGLFCRWDEAVERYYNNFTLNLCKVDVDTLPIDNKM